MITFFKPASKWRGYAYWEGIIGFYTYGKRLNDGSVITCRVTVFPLKVEEQLASWPEKDQRQTQWLAAQEAAKAIQEPELRAIIQSLY